MNPNFGHLYYLIKFKSIVRFLIIQCTMILCKILKYTIILKKYNQVFNKKKNVKHTTHQSKCLLNVIAYHNNTTH